MPLRGGAAAKFGDRYEGQWTVYCLSEILMQEATALRPEVPGEDGFEFWLRRKDATVEFHQSKRQQTESGQWSLAGLRTAGVLAAVRSRLSEDEDAQCVFASGASAGELSELAERAEGAQSFDEFTSEFLSSNADVRRWFDTLRGYWGTSDEVTYEYLRRTSVETASERFLRRTVRGRLLSLVAGGTPDTVADVLAQFALESVHQEITEHRIWEHLKHHDLRPREWSRDISVLQAVNTATNRLLEQLRRESIPTPAGPIVISRVETAAALEHLTAGNRKPGVLLAGAAGAGKSGVLLQVTDTLSELGWPILAFRVDRFSDPNLSADELGIRLGLPGSPAPVLAAIAQGQQCLLVLDQLSAFNKFSQAEAEMFRKFTHLMFS
jgi:hypothetical protein